MTETKLPWLMGQSIFQYVKTNINKEGFFTKKSLPDSMTIVSIPDFSADLGGTDAYLVMADNFEESLVAASIYDAIEAYEKSPGPEQALALYGKVCSTACITYHEELVELLGNKTLSAALQKLALTWLYNSPHREAVKFAILLCGLIRLNAPAKHFEFGAKLHQELLMLARCEEFTCYVVYTGHFNKTLTSQELFALIQHTTGWGKVCAMEAYQYKTPAEQEWLLVHGTELSVSYPGIGLLALQQGHLAEELDKRKLGHATYIGCLKAVNNYLLFLLGYGELDDSDEERFPVVDLNKLIGNVLRHAKNYCETIEDVAGLINLSQELRAMAEAEDWQYISSNHCHLLLSQAEKLLFHKDWLPEITAQLLKADGSVNYAVVSFAVAMQADIHTKLFAILKKDPWQTELYYYLLLTHNKRRFNAVMAFAKKYLMQYKDKEGALDPILAALGLRGGTEGSEVVIAGLTSIYDGTRGQALSVLENSSLEAITPEVRAALVRARAMSQHPFLVFRIDVVLKKKQLNLNSLLETLSRMDG